MIASHSLSSAKAPSVPKNPSPNVRPVLESPPNAVNLIGRRSSLLTPWTGLVLKVIPVT